MKPPIDRDKQIELMKYVQERNSDCMHRWMNTPMIREALMRSSSKHRKSCQMALEAAHDRIENVKPKLISGLITQISDED